MQSIKKKIYNHLNFIYNEDIATQYTDLLLEKVLEKKLDITPKQNKWDEKDVFLITYGDSIINKNEKPLVTLHSFLNKYLKDTISIVHILPCFPYSSDDGFSVIDYYMVNPELGDWSDINAIENDYKTMYDFVINHISQHSQWYKNYKLGIEPFSSFFIEASPDDDLSMVVRPRSLPLLTKVDTNQGEKYVWTTFSDDQIDLNFSNPDCMLEMMSVLMEYIHKGATVIRLDAIAFLWKQLGTNCLHLPQTHRFVKLMRDLAETINSEAIILTETNVPNKENLSYFGENDEAHVVYQFSFPPLMLYTLYTGNSEYLTQWAQTIPQLPESCTFFNFTASHDGIGVRPLEGILKQDEINNLANAMKNFGGYISTKRNSDGTDSPYEMNITYFDALKGTKSGEDNLQAARFICSQTIMMAMKGIPAFYIHSLTATPNYYEGVNQTGRARSINRMKWDRSKLEKTLDTDTVNRLIFNELTRLIKIRKQQSAFNPNSEQNILDINSNVFAFERKSEDQNLIAISNITNGEVILDYNLISMKNEMKDLISGNIYVCSNIKLKPYQTLWLIN